MLFTAMPSIAQLKSWALFWKNAAQLRKSASVVRLPSRVEHSVLIVGKNSALPAGTEQCRSATPTTVPEGSTVVEKVPPKNQTGPLCPALQSAVSNNG